MLSAPFDLRLPMARDATLLSAVLRIFCSEIDRLLQRLGEERGIRHGASGLVASIQLFGGSLNLNPHFHVLGLDGVYSTSADGRVVFTATRAPAQSELLDVTQRVHKRVLRWLKRHGAGDEHDKAEDDEPSPAASCAQLSLRLGKLGYVDSDGVAHAPDPDHAPDDNFRWAIPGRARGRWGAERLLIKCLARPPVQRRADRGRAPCSAPA